MVAPIGYNSFPLFLGNIGNHNRNKKQAVFNFVKLDMLPLSNKLL